MRRDWIRVAHRGASAHAPENTLAAFRRALEIRVDAIEFDVRLTRDGEVVVIHDPMLDRTTDASGCVARTDLAELRHADAGGWFGAAFRGERVPTLAEALAVIPEDVLAVVEIKAPEAAVPTARILRRAEALDRVLIFSFSPEALEAVRREEARLSVALLVDDAAADDREPPMSVPEMLWAAHDLGTSALALNWRLATPETVWRIRRRGGSVWAWTVNDPAAIEAVADAGVAAIISDYPDRLNAILAAPEADLLPKKKQGLVLES